MLLQWFAGHYQNGFLVILEMSRITSVSFRKLVCGSFVFLLRKQHTALLFVSFLFYLFLFSFVCFFFSTISVRHLCVFFQIEQKQQIIFGAFMIRFSKRGRIYHLLGMMLKSVSFGKDSRICLFSEIFFEQRQILLFFQDQIIKAVSFQEILRLISKGKCLSLEQLVFRIHVLRIHQNPFQNPLESIRIHQNPFRIILKDSNF